MTKKILSLILSLAMVLSLMVPVSLAADGSMTVKYSSTMTTEEITNAKVTSVSSDYDRIEWTLAASGKGVVFVDPHGDKNSEAYITGLSAGTADITVKAYESATKVDGETPIATKTLTITVTEDTDAVTITKDLPSANTVYEDAGTKLTIAATSSQKNDLSYQWTIDGDVAPSSYSNNTNTFNTSGLIAGYSYFIKCKVTAKNSGAEATTTTCKLTVRSSTTDNTDELTGVSIDSKLSLDVGDTETLEADVSGCSYKDVTFTWTSSNENIAYLSSSSTSGKGVDSVKVKGKKAGTATITCKAKYGSVTKTDTCKVTVTDDDDDDDGDFKISKELPSSYTATYGVSGSISFSVTNNTDYTTKYQWYVDGSKDDSSSTNSFNTKNLSLGTHKVSCNAYTSKGDYSVNTQVCSVTVMELTSGSMSNFSATKTYNGEFTDVPSSEWFYPYIKTSYEYGLVNGKTDTTYNPYDNFTVAEALKIAACINCTYLNKSEYTQQNLINKAGTGENWYAVYVQYCIDKSIIKSGDFTDYNAFCTRAQMAYIFSRCLPSSELPSIRTVTIPDCNSSTPYFSNIQTLYNAGVVSGDPTHSYYPNNPIRRSEVAKIVCTLVVPSTRDLSTF